MMRGMKALHIGTVGESFLRLVVFSRIALLALFVYSCPIVRGEVAQLLRAMHTDMPQTTIIPVPGSDVYKHNRW